MTFVLALRMVAALLIGLFEKDDFNPTAEEIRAMVDHLIGVFVSVEDATEYNTKIGCTLTLDADKTRVEALIDCYVMDMAYIDVSIEGQQFRMGYTVIDGEVLPDMTYNGEDLL